MPFLDWVNKNQAKERTLSIPIHLLDPVAIHGSSTAPADNLLIQGDNLLALQSLLPIYAGRVSCIFIDPPYNTQSAFEHYDDRLEHSQWLSMIYPRLVLLRKFLAVDGSIWVTIDENEAHYLKVLMDEVFGRKHFVAEIIWQKRTSRENRAAIGSAHDSILVYSQVPAAEWKKYRNLLPANNKGYANPDNDPRGPWRSVPFSAQGFRANQMYTIVSDSGVAHKPPKGRCWGATEPEFERLRKDGRVYFPKEGQGKPRIKRFPEEDEGLVPMSVWLASEAGTTEEAKKEILQLFDEEHPFGTPKPERLLRQIYSIASNPGDIVLDSFLGSGTAAAVAHKMGRRWIGIEMGEHARTHCIPRLRKVIDGEQGGVSELVDWKGGGAFQFLTLGPPAFDAYGRISPDVRFNTLGAFIWHFETATSAARSFDEPLLGKHNGTAYYLLYDGIADEPRGASSNELTAAVLRRLNDQYPHEGPKVIYGESTRLGDTKLAAEGIAFKQIPYDVQMR